MKKKRRTLISVVLERMYERFQVYILGLHSPDSRYIMQRCLAHVTYEVDVWVWKVVRCPRLTIILDITYTTANC